MADQVLPTPPMPNTDAKVRAAFVKHYFRILADSNPLNPADFLKRVLADYGTDVVKEWLKNLSPLYTAYRAYIKHAIDHGTPDVQEKAQNYQGVGNECQCC
jgi:hypothetical protein